MAASLLGDSLILRGVGEGDRDVSNAVRPVFGVVSRGVCALSASCISSAINSITKGARLDGLLFASVSLENRVISGTAEKALKQVSSRLVSSKIALVSQTAGKCCGLNPGWTFLNGDAFGRLGEASGRAGDQDKGCLFVDADNGGGPIDVSSLLVCGDTGRSGAAGLASTMA